MDHTLQFFPPKSLWRELSGVTFPLPVHPWLILIQLLGESQPKPQLSEEAFPDPSALL